MPELPEVESLTRALRPLAEGRTIKKATFYRTDLREEVPKSLFNKLLVAKKIERLSRRSKYLLFHTQKGVGIFHLGMTGNILCYAEAKPKHKHTHAVFHLEKQGEEPLYLHYVDPRRFGFISCCGQEELENHRYFGHLGPEPLLEARLGDFLFAASRKRKTPVKSFIMDAKVLVGVGNIYASEALFKAKIHPLTLAGQVDKKEWQRLGRAIKDTLKKAIKAGGTSFRDFKLSDGNKGYFAVSLNVYGREHKPCPACGLAICQTRISNRSTFYCQNCQEKKP